MYDPEYKRYPGSQEMYKDEGKYVNYFSFTPIITPERLPSAKDYFGLTDSEVGVLPYYEFKNKFNLNQSERSYPFVLLQNLVYRKFAMLAGFHDLPIKGLRIHEEGKTLYDE